MPSLRSRRAAAWLSTSTLFTAFFVISSPLAANAHDQVISTAPASQEVLEIAPSEVSLDFSDDILDIGATIMVVDSGGEDWASGEMRVEARSAVQTVAAAMPEGSYQVRWQVVPSQGHPISGTFEFAVGQPSAPVAASGTASDPEPVATLPAAADSSADRDGTVAPPLVIIGFGGAVVGGGLFLLITTLVKSRRRRT